MKAYLWNDPDNFPNKRRGKYNEEISPDRFMFFGGTYINEMVGEIVVDFGCQKRQIEKYEVIPNNSASPIIREDVLEFCGDLLKDQIQIFDIELRAQDDILKHYKLINILNLVKGVDLGESICDYMTDEVTIAGYQYLVLKENCLGNLHIARLEETNSHIIVSDALTLNFSRHSFRDPDTIICEFVSSSLAICKLPKQLSFKTKYS